MASVYSVSQVNAYIKNMFAQDFALRQISIKGEVSNCKYHSSGHIYFTLKDGKAAIAAVMFAGQRKGLGFQLQEGQQVIVRGSVEVYERDGRYQMYAQKIERDGMGGLFERFQKLRDELEEMGMFSAEYKQPIPHYARTVGVVTAATGAAVHDIMNISSRRNPYVQLILYPARVQGEEAKYSIVRGIRALDQMGVDVIIVGRGGGSIEDLWAFNEEIVARAIFECGTPVISAVGHETDVTIADYVADLRAPTPSAAAELAVFDYRRFVSQVELYQEALQRSISRRVEKRRYRLEQYRLHLKMFDPGRQIRERRQRLSDIQERMEELLSRQLSADKQKTASAGERLSALIRQKLLKDRHRLELDSGRLDSLSPLKKIGGGFGFLTDGAGRRLDSVKQVSVGDPVILRLPDGKVEADVTGKDEQTLESLYEYAGNTNEGNKTGKRGMTDGGANRSGENHG